jgi:hypothetical protein
LYGIVGMEFVDVSIGNFEKIITLIFINIAMKPAININIFLIEIVKEHSASRNTVVSSTLGLTSTSENYLYAIVKVEW